MNTALRFRRSILGVCLYRGSWLSIEQFCYSQEACITFSTFKEWMHNVWLSHGGHPRLYGGWTHGQQTVISHNFRRYDSQTDASAQSQAGVQVCANAGRHLWPGGQALMMLALIVDQDTRTNWKVMTRRRVDQSYESAHRLSRSAYWYWPAVRDTFCGAAQWKGSRRVDAIWDWVSVGRRRQKGSQIQFRGLLSLILWGAGQTVWVGLNRTQWRIEFRNKLLGQILYIDVGMYWFTQKAYNKMHTRNYFF